VKQFAPAKINLFLRVWPPGLDGYHPLQSWMVFADVGDFLEMTPAEAMGFEVKGPFAPGVPADGANLAVRARDAFLAVSAPITPFTLTLDKHLPPASGIGGGSADAAAVLRLLQQQSPIDEQRLYAIALALGADVPACLKSAALIAKGRGEVFEAAPCAPPLPAVLANPKVAVSTAEVFAAFDAQGEESGQFERRREFWPEWSADGDPADVAAAIALITPPGNDLQRAAEILAPEVVDVIRALERDRRCRLARMSGSGATCFGLCLTIEDAQGLAAELAAEHPHWWVRATTLS